MPTLQKLRIMISSEEKSLVRLFEVCEPNSVTIWSDRGEKGEEKKTRNSKHSPNTPEKEEIREQKEVQRQELEREEPGQAD